MITNETAAIIGAGIICVVAVILTIMVAQGQKQHDEHAGPRKEK